MGARRSRWTGVLGALLAISLGLPAAVHAATPMTLTLETDKATAFTDEVVTLTVTASPAVAGLVIRFLDENESFSFQRFEQTDDAGVARTTIQGSVDQLIWVPHFFHATFEGDATHDPATSNTVEVDLDRHPSSVSLTWGSPWVDGVVNTVDPLILHPRLTATTCNGGFEIQEIQDGQTVGTGGASAHVIDNGNGTTSCGADIWYGQIPLGTHHFKAFYGNSWTNENSESGIVDVPITLITTNTALSATPDPVEVGSPTRLTATVSTPKGIGFIDNVGTVTFFDGATELGTTAFGQPFSGQARLDVTFGSAGSHQLHATWSGSTTAEGSTSPDIALVVAANVVHATGLGLGASTIYPVVDGYGDTVAIRGTLGETASVAITITNARTGSVVRRLAVPSRDAGPYSVTWNGRSSSGALLAAGTYRVKQVATDTLGATLSVTSSIALSLKKLYWHSGSKTLYANPYSAKGGAGGTIASTTAYYRGMRITLPLGTPGRWAALGYQFTLPSATKYSSIAFWVLGKGTHVAIVGLQDRRIGTWPSGSRWIVDDFSPLVSVPKAYGWTHVSGNSTYNRIGRTVRGMILALDWSSGATTWPRSG